jgi:hypothetical protein
MQRYYCPIAHQPRTQQEAWDRIAPQDKRLLTPRQTANLSGYWVLEEFETPEGFVATGPETYREEPETRTAYAERETITQAAYDEAQEAAEQAAFASLAWSLPLPLVDAYAAFMAAFEQAVGAAMMAGAEINPQAVTYQNLIAELNQLDGEQWLKTANTLMGLWSVVVVHTGKTPGEAYMMQPMMEWRRNNPPPETGEGE